MLIQPIRGTITAYTLGTLTLRRLVINVIKCISSLTVAGLIWCIGYIASNHVYDSRDEEIENGADLNIQIRTILSYYGIFR